MTTYLEDLTEGLKIETERRVEGADYRDASGAARLLARADAIER